MTSPSVILVSTEDRAALRTAMEDFLAGRCDNRVYDDRIQDISRKTRDPTVVWVVRRLWFSYDDLSAHQVKLTREGWDLHQRLLLLLASGARVEEERDRRWHGSQAVAIAMLLAGAAAWWWRDLTVMWWTPALLLVVLAVAFFNQRWRTRVAQRWLPPDQAGPDWAMPFPSVADVRHAYRLTPGFRKKPCPAALRDGRSSGGPLMAWIDRKGDGCLHQVWKGVFVLMVWMGAPLWLAFQCLPVTARRERVVVPEVG